MKNLTDEQLVKEHVKELTRTATIPDAGVHYTLGCLEMTLELIIRKCPDARKWLEEHVAHVKTIPTTNQQ